MTALEALQNMATHADSRIVVHVSPQEDKRRTVPKFFAQLGNKTNFLLGYAKAKGQP